MYKEVTVSCFLIFLAIFAGSLTGIYTAFGDPLSQYLDYIILALVFLVLADAPLHKIMPALKQPVFLAVTWVTNFLILPVLGFAITQLFLPEQPLLAIGLAVYFMSPCTDWFLGFARMANGNTAMGSVLLPINMLTQFILYPLYLQWFSESTAVSISATEVFSTFMQWFLIPAACALVLKILLSNKFSILPEAASGQIANLVNKAINWVMYLLVFVIFAANIQQIISYQDVFIILLATIMCFFVVSGIITEIIAKKFRFNHGDHVLYTVTTTARNAPLMLGLTMTAIPDQPLIYAAIITGMLVEFPYLALQVYRFNLSKGAVDNTETASTAS